MKHILTVVALGLGGLALAVALSLGAFALAGHPLGEPATAVRVPAAGHSNGPSGDSHSPSPTTTPFPSPSDDHGGGSPSPGDDHGGTGHGSDD